MPVRIAWVLASVRIAVLLAMGNPRATPAPETVSFDSGGKILHGLIYKPDGASGSGVTTWNISGVTP